MTTYAKTVAIFTGKSQFNVVDSYYRLVPFETASSMFTLAVNKTVRVPNLTFERLLDTMLVESSSYDMFLIVDHGLENSKKIVTQLSMPLTCGNVLLGLIGQPLNHSSTTNLHRRPATAGRYRTDRTGPSRI